MIHLELDAARIVVRPGATDMRKQINGLVLLVQEQMQLSPFGAALFVFCNAQRRVLKAVYRDRTGFCLWCKRLEKGRFPWPRTAAEARREIDARSRPPPAARPPSAARSPPRCIPACSACSTSR